MHLVTRANASSEQAYARAGHSPAERPIRPRTFKTATPLLYADFRLSRRLAAIDLAGKVASLTAKLHRALLTIRRLTGPTPCAFCYRSTSEPYLDGSSSPICRSILQLTGYLYGPEPWLTEARSDPLPRMEFCRPLLHLATGQSPDS